MSLQNYIFFKIIQDTSWGTCLFTAEKSTIIFPVLLLDDTLYNSIDVLLVQLILMKIGGQIIYSGMLGRHSSKLIEYFEVSTDSQLAISKLLVATLMHIHLSVHMMFLPPIHHRLFLTLTIYIIKMTLEKELCWMLKWSETATSLDNERHF